jgi:large subunit ribosomal protein L24e
MSDRLSGGKNKKRREARKELEQSISLVKAPLALKEDGTLTLPKQKVTVSYTQTETAPMEE